MPASTSEIPEPEIPARTPCGSCPPCTGGRPSQCWRPNYKANAVFDALVNHGLAVQRVLNGQSPEPWFPTTRPLSPEQLAQLRDALRLNRFNLWNDLRGLFPTYPPLETPPAPLEGRTGDSPRPHSSPPGTWPSGERPSSPDAPLTTTCGFCGQSHEGSCGTVPTRPNTLPAGATGETLCSGCDHPFSLHVQNALGVYICTHINVEMTWDRPFFRFVPCRCRNYQHGGVEALRDARA